MKRKEFQEALEEFATEHGWSVEEDLWLALAHPEFTVTFRTMDDQYWAMERVKISRMLDTAVDGPSINMDTIKNFWDNELE